MVTTEADGRIELKGLSDDGTVAYANVIRDPDTKQETAVAMRFTEALGFVPLPALSDHDQTEVRGFSKDGSLAVGVSFVVVDGARKARSVLWDATGTRDLAGELEGAGIDLQGLERLSVERVWTGTPIRLQGIGYVHHDIDYTQLWFAELPAR